MRLSGSFEQRLADQYDQLSRRIRDAGDYVARNPFEVATRSLRSVSEESGLAPATFSRLARGLNYDTFEALRDEMRRRISTQISNFADRAERLQVDHGAGAAAFFPAHVSACLHNIEQMSNDLDQRSLEEAADRLHAANEVLLFGALGSTGVVEYLAYMANFCKGNWRLANRMGASLGGALSDMGPGDAMIVVTKPPYSARVIRAAKFAHEQGVYVIVITDTHACPALRSCSASFLVPTDSPHFYSSYAATIVLVESLIGMIVGRTGPDTRARIARIEESNRRLDEVSDG